MTNCSNSYLSWWHQNLSVIQLGNNYSLDTYLSLHMHADKSWMLEKIHKAQCRDIIF